LAYILTECKAPGQELIWKLTETLWKETGKLWLDIFIEVILGCGLSNYLVDNEVPDTGLNRLFLIIVSESAYLIWKMQCEWIIKYEGQLDKHPSAPKVTAKWRSTISKWIQFKIIASNSGRFKNKVIPFKLVEKTWGKLLKTESLHSLRMQDITRFLVGIGLDNPP
ncbi:hypothetical protein M422DRAFT_175078, partial [Sphaerobolus stellatus SS14]